MISLTSFNININMGFHSYIYESLRSTGLKRIRIKTDPSKIQDNIDLRSIEGYEGYVLKEGAGKMKVLVLNSDMSVMDLPEGLLEHIYEQDQIDILNEFKTFCKEYLKTEKNKKLNDPLFHTIDSSQNYGEIESILKQNNITENELNSLYREFIEK